MFCVAVQNSGAAAGAGDGVHRVRAHPEEKADGWRVLHSSAAGERREEPLPGRPSL